MKTIKKSLFLNLGLIAWLILAISDAQAQGTAFTYNGRLNVNGGPANGSYDLSFTLYTAATNGTAIGAETNTATPVTNGLFIVTLDFGGVFNGSNYWLAIAVSTNGAGTFTALNPLQPITPTPYAIYAENAGSAATAVTAGTAASANSVVGANITGTVPLAQLPSSVLTNNQTGVTLSGTFNGNGVGLSNLDLTGPTPTSSSGNLASGYLALAANTTGVNNTAYGIYALESNTTGGFNTANGYRALYSNISGNANTATGYKALLANTSGTGNTANGYFSLNNNTIGNYNTAYGDATLLYNTTGNNNNAIGNSALIENTTGNDNTANGYFALSSNNEGSGNSANGYEALYANTTGSYNTAQGYQSLYNNTNGYYNTASGWLSLYSNTAGYANSANGPHTLYANTAGSYNAAMGDSALYSNIYGSYNTANGYFSLHNNLSGSNNIALGSLAGSNITTGSYNIDIGNLGLSTDANIIRIGSGQGLAFIAGIINGNGAGLTNLNAAALTGKGSLPAGVLPVNIALLNSNQTFTGLNVFSTNVAIGAASTPERFEVDGTDTAYSPGCSIRIHNTFDPVGGFIGDGWNAIQFGMYNPSAALSGIIPPGAKRSFFGFDQNGNVGSLANNFSSPNYRNLLDDGNGNMSVSGVISGNGAGLTNLNFAGATLISSNGNSAIGYQALESYRAGFGNTADGASALFSITNGFANTAEGFEALYSNTNGSCNTANGAAAMASNITGVNNTVSGALALLLNTTGSNNIAEGYQAGINITNGNYDIDIGNQGLANDNGIIRIGDVQTQAIIAGVITGNGNGLTNLNPGSLNPGTAAISISGNAATATTVTGNIVDSQLSANVALLNGTNTFSGTNTLAGPVMATNAANMFAGTFTGNGAGLTNLPLAQLPGSVLTNNASGVLLNNLTVGGNLTLPALPVIYSGGGTLLYADGNYNFFTGPGTGNGTNTSGMSNAALGYQALANDTSGGGNTAIGASALNANTNGAANTAVGCFSLIANISGKWNTANGYSTLTGNTTGNDNTADGFEALDSVASGSQNTADGASALATLTNGSGNIALGFQAGYSNNQGSGNIYIGNTGNNGESDIIRIGTQGTQTATYLAGTVYANGVELTSDRNAKENFKLVNNQAVLARVAALPVSEWKYKTDHAGVQHIGPMAQDFQAAFQLSADDKHISVVDEGGVALAAIQGLNQKLTEKLDEKDAEIQALNTRLEKLEHMMEAKK